MLNKKVFEKKSNDILAIYNKYVHEGIKHLDGILYALNAKERILVNNINYSKSTKFTIPAVIMSIKKKILQDEKELENIKERQLEIRIVTYLHKHLHRWPLEEALAKTIKHFDL